MTDHRYSHGRIQLPTILAVLSILSLCSATVLAAAEAGTPVFVQSVDRIARAGEVVYSRLLWIDPDGPVGEQRLEIAEGPPGASVSSYGVFYWTPPLNQPAGTNLIRVRLLDSGPPQTEAFTSFHIIIRTNRSELDQWEWLQPKPTGASLNSIAHGNGIWVGVGEGGAIVRSTNGILWSLEHLPYPSTASAEVLLPSGRWGAAASTALRTVAFGSSRFVCAGDYGSIYISDDGRNWFPPARIAPTAESDPDGFLSGPERFGPLLDLIHVEGRGFVGIFSYGAVALSTDGLKWEVTAVDDSYSFHSIAFGNGTFAILATDRWNSHGKVVLSEDARHWQGLTLPGALESGSITFAANQFLVAGQSAGNDSFLWASRDAQKWESAPQPTPSRSLDKLFSADGTFWATAGTDLYRSPDAVTWVKLEFGAEVADLAAAEGLFAAVGRDGAIWTSNNGETWTNRSEGARTSGRDVVFVPGLGFFVPGGLLMRSPNGMDWSLSPDLILRSLVWGKDRLIGVGYAPRIAHSQNGIDWTPVFDAPAPALNSVVYGQSIHVAVGAFGGIVTSPDGLAWEPRDAGTTAHLEDIAFGKETFVAVGRGQQNEGVILTSQNGATWQVQTQSFTLSGVAFGAGRFIATGQSTNSGGSVILISTDGLTWREKAGPGYNWVSSINYADGQFWAMADYGTLHTSEDGETWSQYAAVGTSMFAVNSGAGQVLAVGAPGIRRPQAPQPTAHAPTLSPVPLQTVPEGDLLSVKMEAQDLDLPDDFLVFTLEAGPPGAILHPQTGQLEWRPPENAGPGTHLITVRVTDSGVPAQSATVQFSVNVEEVNAAPRVLPPPDLVRYGEPNLQLTFSVYDPETNTISAEILEGPASFFTWSGPAPQPGIYGMLNEATNHLRVRLSDNGIPALATEIEFNLLLPADPLDPLSHWEWVPPFLSGDDLAEAAFGNGTWVAVGDNGVILWSTNALQWNRASAATKNRLSRVAFGNGRFVAVGQSVLSSEDGHNWQVVNPGSGAYIDALTFGNGLFVAATAGGTILVSPDGISWSRGHQFSGSPHSLTFGNGEFLLAYGTYPGGETRTILATSTNAIDWREQSFSTEWAQFETAFAGGLFFMSDRANSASAQLYISADGRTWETLTNQPLPAASSIAFNGEIFIGSNSQLANPGLLASADGRTWSDRAGLTNRSPHLLVYRDGTYVALARPSTILVSTNGSVWLDVLPPAQPVLYEISPTDAGFIGVGAGGRIALSTNGADWSEAFSGTTSTLQDAAFGAGVYVVVGPNAGRVLTSSNGWDWTAADVPRQIQYGLQAVTYGNGQFVAVGYRDTAAISTNGTQWSSIWPGNQYTWFDAAHGNGRFVAVGETRYSTGSPAVMHSADGTRWTAVVLPWRGSFSAIAFGNGRFVAAGRDGSMGTLAVSTNGTDWAMFGIPIPINDVCFDGDQFILVGSNQILSTRDGRTYAWHSLNRYHDIRSVAAKSGIAWVSTYYGGLARIGPPEPLQPARLGLWPANVTSSALVGTRTAFGDVSVWNWGDAPGELQIEVDVHWAVPRAQLQIKPGATTQLGFIFLTTGLPEGIHHGTASVRFPGEPAQTISFTLEVRAAGPLDNWRWRSPIPGEILSSVAYGRDQFVAVSWRGAVLTSLDGRHWNPLDLPASSFTKVVYGADRFVAAGDNVYVSEDGLRWTPGALPPLFQLNDLFFAAGTFVALGYGLTPYEWVILSSTDGYNWTERLRLESAYGVGGATGNQQFVLLASGTAYVSSDGIEWTQHESKLLAGPQYVPPPAYGNGRYVTVGREPSRGDPILLVSDNGASWESHRLPPDQWISNIGFVAGHFVAPAGEYLLTSNDGIDWLPTKSALSNAWVSFAEGGGHFVAVGFQYPGANLPPRAIIATSLDGVFWTDHTQALPADFISILAGNNRFLAVSTNSVWSSADRRNWRLARSSISPFSAAAFSGDIFVLTAEDGTVHVSEDAATWRTSALPNIDRIPRALAFGGSLLVAVGDGGLILSSRDAIEWQPHSSPSAATLSGVAYGDGRFVAVGTAGTILVSTNGIAWSQNLETFTFADLGSIAWRAGVFVAVGAGETILVSNDAQRWTRATVPETLYYREPMPLHQVYAGGDRFVAVGDFAGPWNWFESVVLSSLDGQKWTRHTDYPSLTARGVVSDGTSWIIVGHSGSIVEAQTAPVDSPILLLRRSPQMQLVLHGDINYTYSIQETADPSDLSSWREVGRVSLNTEASAVFPMPDPRPFARFYRAVLVP